jgi:iron complex transport system substrate-binding protein
VQEDRTLYTTFETPLSGALAYSRPHALIYALDVMVPQLAAATDDNPATPVTDLSKAV